MSQFVFKNKWLVLALAVLVLAAAQALVSSSGTPHEGESADRHDVSDTGSPVPDVVVVPASADSDDADSSADDASQSFVDDDDLIDKADGYDPTPSDQQADDSGGSNDDNGDAVSDDGDN